MSADSPVVSSWNPFKETVLSCLVATWIMGVTVFAGRLWFSWQSVRKLARSTTEPLPTIWEKRFQELKSVAGVRHLVRAGETAAVAVPIVIGWFKPVILLPLGVLTHLSPEQVEAIFLHELAHIRRHDFAVNLLQSVVETVYFYHPAVHSISRRIREERERVCDDLSVQWCRNPVAYAEALVTFEEYRRDSLALAATGEGDLLARVRRIVLGTEPHQNYPRLFAAAGIFATGAYLASMFLAPALAESVISARERVTQIQALQPSPGPENSTQPYQNIYVNGTLTTEDNQPLPASLFEGGQNLLGSEAKVTSTNMNVWSSGELYMTNPNKDHKFYGNTANGRIEIGVWAEGYAPVRRSGLEPKGKELAIDLVLKRGFPAGVQLTGPNGELLKDVLITATSSRPSEKLELSMPPVKTDANGIAHFGQVEADSPIHLVAFKSGWQMSKQVVSQWSKGSPLVWKLAPAQPTSGVVIDQVKRTPIATAQIVMAARRAKGTSNYTTYGPDEGQVLGQTDSQGHFTLQNLSQEESYFVYVKAVGYPVVSFPIEYGQQGRVCELSPGFHLRGTILDKTGVLASKEYYHPIQLEVFHNVDATPFNSFGMSTRLPLPRLGREIPFSFEHLPAGRTSLGFAIDGLGRYRYEIDLKQDTDNYVIALDQKPAPETKDLRPLRTVEISFKTPAGIPPLGLLNSGYGTSRNDENWITTRVVPLVAGKATADYPVPTRLQFNSDRLVGYWFAPQTIELSDGSGIFDREVSVVPAGVVHGKATLPDAFKNRSLSMAAVTLKDPPGVDKVGANYVPLSVHGDYVSTPLPFGGTYAALLDAGPSYYVSPAVQVDAGHPLVLQNLEPVPVNSVLKGRFVDGANRPIAYQEVMLTYHPSAEDEFLCHAATTDGDGNFTITGINWNVPGNYEVEPYGLAWGKSKVRIDGNTSQPVVIPIQALNSPEIRASTGGTR